MAWILNFLVWFQKFPVDDGPIYKETMEGRFPVEPYNTFSNFLFLLAGIYFAVKIYKSRNKHYFLRFALPVLFIGFIGGTVYHATRSADFWLYLDWVPIVFLCLATSFYFAWKAGKENWQRVLLCLAVIGVPVLFRSVNWPGDLQISMGYIGTALGVLLPIFAYSARMYFKHFYLVALAILCFSAAIVFRIFDNSMDFLSMGSHWLWHVFGAFAVFLLMFYIFRDKEKKT